AGDRRHVLDLPLRHELLCTRAARVDHLIARTLAFDREALELDRLFAQREVDDEVLAKCELEVGPRQRLEAEPLCRNGIRAANLQTRYEIAAVRIGHRGAHESGALMTHGDLDCAPRPPARVDDPAADHTRRRRLRNDGCAETQAEYEREAEQGSDASDHWFPLVCEVTAGVGPAD